MWDSRDYITVPIGGEELSLRMKYQGPHLDLALLDGGERTESAPSIVVRVSGLMDLEAEELEPIVFALAAPDFLRWIVPVPDHGDLSEGYPEPLLFTLEPQGQAS